MLSLAAILSSPALTPPLALIGGFGVPELLVVLLILVLIFGASKLPQLGKGLGEGIRNFKHGLKTSRSSDELAEGEKPKSER